MFVSISEEGVTRVSVSLHERGVVPVSVSLHGDVAPVSFSINTGGLTPGCQS